MVRCPSVCPIGILTVTRQGAACDAARIHFGSTTTIMPGAFLPVRDNVQVCCYLNEVVKQA